MQHVIRYIRAMSCSGHLLWSVGSAVIHPCHLLIHFIRSLWSNEKDPDYYGFLLIHSEIVEHTSLPFIRRMSIQSLTGKNDQKSWEALELIDSAHISYALLIPLSVERCAISCEWHVQAFHAFGYVKQTLPKSRAFYFLFDTETRILEPEKIVAENSMTRHRVRKCNVWTR